jgi:hypothetical protein
VTFIDEAETKYFHPLVKEVLPKIEAKQPLDKAELEAFSEVGQWYTYLKENGHPFIGAIYPGWHRGALEKKQRLEAINRFMSVKPIQTGAHLEYPIDVMIATKTLELGIDIGTVSTVMNCSAPLSNNEYYQRVGRGGRRGNSLALTILNDTGAIDAYFAAKVEELIRSPQFEAIPIIVTNKIIARQHVIGRILDFIAESLKADDKAFEVKVRHLREMKLRRPGYPSEVELEQDPENFAKALYHHIFESSSISNKGVSCKAIDKYCSWLSREAAILDVAPTDIDEKRIETWLINKCKRLAEHGDPVKKDLYWDDEMSLSGYFTTVDRDLLTPLRGDGATVAIYTKEVSQDKFVEEVSRIRAIRSLPPRAYTRQGLNSFQIQSPVMKEDVELEKDLVDLFWDDEDVLEYFGEKLGDGFPKTTRDLRYFAGQIVIPAELQVNYAPYRFYCDNSSCLRSYTHHELDENLLCQCNRPLKQSTHFIMCPQCGDLMEPPIPKVCINPSCIKKKMDSDPDFLRKLRSASSYTKAAKPLFRFKSLAKQHWRCVECGVVFNFYNYHLGMWNDPRLKQVKDIVLSGRAYSKWDLATPVGIALKFLYFPEHYKRRDEYVKMGYRPAMFKHWPKYGGCDKAKGGLRIINIPTITTFQHRYLRKIRELDTPMTVNIGDLEIFELQVIDIAREFSRAYDKGAHFKRRERVYKIEEIFENKFLGNLYETHAFALSFGDLLEEFLKSDLMPKECAELCDPGCPHLSELNENIREIYVPKMEVKPWELIDGKPKKNDPRSMWCTEAGGSACRPECLSCDYYINNSDKLRPLHLRYILLHTLKHGIVWALPKYVGINLMGLSGHIYPNQNNLRDDPLTAELVIMDSAENGSGAILLVKKNWKDIWEFAATVFKLTNEGRGNLNLPYSCFRFNEDLCPKLALQFVNFIDSIK